MNKILLSVAAVLSLTACGGGASFQPGSITGGADVNLVACDADGIPRSTPATFSMSVEGAGNFRLSANGDISLSKSGTFQLEISKDGISCIGINGLNPSFSGYLAMADGRRLTGYGPNANGVLDTSMLTEVNVFSGGDMPPNETKSMNAQLNLDSSATALSSASFDASSAATYHFSAPANFFDTLGFMHSLQLDFVKTAADTWDVFAVNDEKAGASPFAVKIAQLAFGANGALSSAMQATPVDPSILSWLGTPAIASPSTTVLVAIPVDTGAVSPVLFSVNFAGTTQKAAAFSTISVTQDGFASGRVSGFSIASDGKIVSRYDNGQSRLVGQVAIVP